MDSVTKPQAKKMLKEYNTKLEELRSTLLATKHKSIFADEKKLREYITEVYASVCSQECKPSNLQLGRITVLNDDLKKGEESYEKITSEYQEKAHTTITAEKGRSKTTSVNSGN